MDEELEVGAVSVTSSETGSRLRGVADMAGLTVGVETRETLVNELVELAEAYEEGWQSSDESCGEE